MWLLCSRTGPTLPPYRKHQTALLIASDWSTVVTVQIASDSSSSVVRGKKNTTDAEGNIWI